MSKSPDELTTKLGIEISPGKITPLDEIDVTLLSSLAKPNPVPDMMSGNPIAGEAVYYEGGYKFSVKNGKPITLELGNNAEAVLWDLTRQKRYVMPLSAADVAELFGSPDRQVDTFQF